MSIKVKQDTRDKDIELSPQDIREVYYIFNELRRSVERAYAKLFDIMERNNINA